MSQSSKDTLKTQTLSKRNVSTISSVNERSNGDYAYEFCDDDTDGFMVINIASLESDVLAQEGLEEGDQEALLISTSGGRIVKFNYPYSNSNIETICLDQISGIPQSDVAVDENGVVYSCTFDGLFRLESDPCNDQILFSFSFGTDVNALSFDTKGNMYYGIGASSQVYRYDADELSNPYVWHDFITGGSGGDFVMLNGKLYIAWKQDSVYKLFEVTVDANINYVSHIELGQLPDNTYGLASEFGNLYGVTPDSLYRIDLDTFYFHTIIINDGFHGDWWGAAGLHEAIEFDVNTYISLNDATSQTNEIENTWTNTQSEGQIIYVRIDNITQNTFEILPVLITIGILPQITTPDDLIKCTNDPNTPFDLTEVENQLLLNVNHEVEVTYYDSFFDLTENVNQLSTIYESPIYTRVVYVKVKNTLNDCYAWSSVVLRKVDPPNLEPIVSEPTERLLANCYINNAEQGYFKLNEILDVVEIDASLNQEFHFYASYIDAINEVNPLNSTYVSTIDVVEEIFVKVINESGCSEITNFFIDGDCVYTTTDLSNLYFPEYFTPNNDSYHDYWNIKGVSPFIREDSIIYIFNRYGNLIFMFKPSQVVGWDGTLNSSNLPSDDYWYKMTTFNGQEFSGHFSLKR